MRLHDYPKLHEEYVISRVRASSAARAARVAAIKTPADAQAYVASVRAELAKAFGPLPPRTPLAPRVWQVNEHPEFRLERVTFASRPGFWVSANLYVPKGLQAPAPGVMVACGHSAVGKAHPLYVEACIRLVRAGNVVLIFDPINQGERDLYDQYPTDGRLTRHRPCDGHNVMGRQLHAQGDWFGAWLLWDQIRAVDYLASRPEVDASKLAATGNSGGGTQTAYLWSMEPRLRAVASSCWCTTYLLDIENGMPADEEQYPPGLLAAGLDKIDFFMARAGEPALLLGQEHDIFDDRGLRAGHGELRRVHTLLGGDPNACALHMDTGFHGFSQANQVAMVAFFHRIFGRGTPPADRPVTPPPESELQVTPDCHVTRAGSLPMNSMIAERARQLAAARPTLAPSALAERLRQALAVPELANIPHHRRLFHTGQDRPETKLTLVRFMVESEPGILCPLRHCKVGPSPYRLAPSPDTYLYLPNLDSQAELKHADRHLGVADYWLLDVRGLGEGLLTLADPHSLYGHDYMLAGYTMMLGDPLLGQRLADVLATVRLLRAEGAQRLHLAGRKQGAVLALLAGLLDPAITTVAAHECPESFLALATAPYTFWPLVNFPRGILGVADLPEVRAALGARLVASSIASSVDWADAAE